MLSPIECVISSAKSLLEQGANPNLVLPSGISPFHLAIGTDSLNALPLIKLLLQYDGNPNVRSADGMTPVHVAATWGRFLALQLLLLNGGDPELCDEDGANATDLAKENENWDCLNLLTSYQTEEDEEDSQLDTSVTRYLNQTRSSCDVHPECSLDSHDSTDFNHNSAHASLDSTGLLSYLPDVSSFSISSFTEDKPRPSRSFFPDLVSRTETRGQDLSEESCSCVSEPERQKRLSLEGKSRGSFDSHGHKCEEATSPVQKQGLGGNGSNFKRCHDRGSTHLDPMDGPSVADEDGVGSEQDEEHDHDRTLSNTYLEEVLMCDNCTGLDVTSPDHISVFMKGSHNGDTPPLDKTIAFLSDRRSIRRSAAVLRQTEVSIASEESSAYVTCQSHDMSGVNAQPSTTKRNPRRVTFSDEQGDSSNLFQQSSEEFGFAHARHVSHDPCRTTESTADFDESLAHTGELSDLLTSDNTESDLLTSDESSLFPPCNGPKTSNLLNGYKQSAHNTVCAEGFERPEAKALATWRFSSGRPPSRLTEDHSTTHESHFTDCSEADSDTEHDSVEYLYHDENTGAMLIERQCPSALGTSSSCQDLSCLNYSHISTIDDTVLYDWRDYQTDEECDSSPPAPPPKELLELTNKGIREMMRKYGEEAGPITATTRMVYLHHLNKLQKDPDFARRAASRQQTFQGFRWELAEYLNSGSLPEPEHQMAQQEKLMVAPFQTPDPSRKWREGTLKSSFNYLLLDPRVTKDLPGRYTQLTHLEAFRMFVAAIFYIGKGKRGRPYAHFYEALSSTKPVDEVKGQTPRKAAKKQPSAKVRHILDIWAAGLGVVSLHCFQSVIPVEAYTREACMVDAMGLSRLTNIKKGDFYGPSTALPARKRRQMGVFLLKKACQIFLVEGERQIRPADIALGQ
ncbi:uncharacterized protein LOC119718911 isoform X2 [Patiria miniata]|uniref:LEM domain-containing protein n=1 Tax=Patiria miniata TaxID=46514 RepID=A0A913YZV9_PATMI|nr:uncharacterized protein LOC119718911 isoform X2 [Patiria miniata]